MTTLAQKIRALRDARGLNNKQLAVAAGIDVSTVSKIVNGRRGVQLGTLEKLAVFFGTTLDALRASPTPVPAASSKAAAKVRSLESRLQAELANGSNPERILDLEIELGQAADALKRQLQPSRR